jgi:hypothetical protein
MSPEHDQKDAIIISELTPDTQQDIRTFVQMVKAYVDPDTGILPEHSWLPSTDMDKKALRDAMKELTVSDGRIGRIEIFVVKMLDNTTTRFMNLARSNQNPPQDMTDFADIGLSILHEVNSKFEAEILMKMGRTTDLSSAEIPRT